MGAPRAEAIAGGAIDDVSNTIVQASLFLLVIPFVGVDIDTSQFDGAGPDRRLLIAIAVAFVLSVVLVLAVPRDPRAACSQACATRSSALERRSRSAEATGGVRRWHCS